MSSEFDEALSRARTHLRNSTLEGLEAARAMLEAAMHASALAKASPDSMVSELQNQLDDLISRLRENNAFALPRALAEPLGAAIDSEIRRWEARSHKDPDARLVLRAFLGMRELLWEISSRDGDAGEAPKRKPPEHTSKTAAPKKDRVQRFKIED